MKNRDYEKFDTRDFNMITEKALVGSLGVLTNDGYPRVVPVNFVAIDRRIYFHGAVHGEKYDLLKASPLVTFSIYLPYSVIPSYWIHKDNAGGASMFFKSLLFKGRCRIVEDEIEKAESLQKLMEKYQPEGGFATITAEATEYREVLKKTAVFRIDADRIHLRAKFHQKKNPAYRRKLIDLLEQRGQGPDKETAEVLRTMLEEDNNSPD